MKIENEIGDLILDLSESPDSLNERFDELIDTIKNLPTKRVGTILKDNELTKLVNNAIMTDKYDSLKNYLSDSFKAIRRSFADMTNFSECSLGLVVNDPPRPIYNIPENNVLYDSSSRKIVVMENFGYIIDKVGSKYSVKKHSIRGDKYNFSNWKFINKQMMSKESVAKLVR